MYGLGERNPLLNPLHEWVISCWEHVMAPNRDFVEGRGRLKNLDRFGFVV